MAKRKKKKRLTEMMGGKLSFIYGLIICLFFLLAVRIVSWNIVNGKVYSTTVLGQKTNSGSEIPYERGKIYDRNGNILAGNEKLYTLVLEPKNILVGDSEKDREVIKVTVDKVNEFFGVSKAKIRSAIVSNPDSYYQPILKGVNYKEMEAFEQYVEKGNQKIKSTDSEAVKNEILTARNVKGVTFEAGFKRIYPYGSLACHLIGFRSTDDSNNWGIEKSYNSVLNGINGRSYSHFDEELVQEKTIKEAVNGNSVVSTIDLQIQQVVENKIKKFDEEIGSLETSVIVMDPNSGEILAMANSDPFDLNEPYKEEYLSMKYSDKKIKEIKEHTKAIADAVKAKDDAKAQALRNDQKKMTITDAYTSIWKNPIISDSHEPGSTYKPFTVATGLESATIKESKKYVCSGSNRVDEHNIGCSHVHGEITLKQAISESCNVAMMNIAFKETKDVFYEYQRLFGFGQKTGVDLPSEASTVGLVYNAETCQNDSSLATNSFGQNFNCTMIQMASAFCALINGGDYYKPHVVKEIQNNNGDIVDTIDKEIYRKVVSEETSEKLRSFMKETVVSGTGKKGAIAGYSIGGKTGTAEKRGRNKEDYYVSFIGFVPVNHPQLLIYVTIDEPHVDDQANASLAVGLERECMKEIVEILGIEPTEKVTGKDENDVDYIKRYLKDHKQKSQTTKAKKKTSKTTESQKKTTKTTEPKKDTKKTTSTKKISKTSTSKKATTSTASKKKATTNSKKNTTKTTTSKKSTKATTDTSSKKKETSQTNAQ
ncbi:MAG: penicillin-binding protein 2 [Eubacteriales bacterium]|nr:penicillin-binding protein 2 [Eubacteriales bacterium]